MPPIADMPGAFEQLVMLAVMQLRENAYGMTVRRMIEERGGRKASLGAVYATLERLERKGYVRSRDAAAAPERGGRGRRFFEITGKGVKALRTGLDAADRLRHGVRELAVPQGSTT
jgi:PadR family transcriptional regulator PadR